MKINLFSKWFRKEKSRKSILMTARLDRVEARAKKLDQGEYGEQSIACRANTKRISNSIFHNMY